MDNQLHINSKRLYSDETAFTVLQLCVKVGISVPRFCYHRELSIAGNCRMCMVEIKNVVKPVVACATSVSKNMHIFTNSELVKNARENVIEFLLINHPLDCPICDQAGECDLQDQTMIYGSDRGRFNELKRSVIDKDFGPVIKTVMTRCIHCTRCIRYAEEIIGLKSIGMMGRGQDSEISTYNNSILHSEMIGNIADICPVGALTIKPYAFKARPWELKEIDLVDIFDSLGSRAMLNYKGGEIVRVLPIRNDFINKEWISDKMRFFYEGITVNRLMFPLLRKHGELVHCYNVFAMYRYVDTLIKSMSSSNLLLLYVGGELDLIESMMVRSYSSQLGIFCFYADQYKKRVNFDMRVNWLLNFSVIDFVGKSNLLLLNVNLKYECTILNSLLYKNLNENEDQVVYFIGSIFNNSYNMFHIGLGSNAVRDIQKGQHEYCFELSVNKVNFVESSTQPLFKNRLMDYLNSLSKIKHDSSYLGMNSTELNTLESGIDSIVEIEDLNDKKIEFMHIFGNVLNFDLVWSMGGFKVFSSHHMPDKYTNSFDLYLPVINFHEVTLKDKDYRSIWLNNQLIDAVLYDYLSIKSGDSESNEYFMKAICKLFSLDMKLEIDFRNDFNLLLNSTQVETKYNNNYRSDLVFIRKMLSSYSYSLFNEVRPETYYKSNIYIKNSVTLGLVYNNLIEGYSYL